MEKQKKYIKKILAMCFALLLLVSCGTIDDKEEQKLKIATSSYGLAQYIEQIGGSEIEIVSVYYTNEQSTNKQNLENADLFIDVKAGDSARRIAEIQTLAPEIQIAEIEINDPLVFDQKTKTYLPVKKDIVEIETENINPFVWLDPVRMQNVVMKIHDILTEELPEREVFFDEKVDETLAGLKIIDKKLKSIANENMQMYITDQSFSYFNQQYQIKEIIVDITNQKELSEFKLKNTESTLFITELQKSALEITGKEQIKTEYLDNLLFSDSPREQSVENIIIENMNKVSSVNQ